MIEVDHKRGTVTFAGEPLVFYIAHCIDCVLTMPFPIAAARDTWRDEHARTGHTIRIALEVRPDGQ